MYLLMYIIMMIMIDGQLDLITLYVLVVSVFKAEVGISKLRS